MLIRVTQDDIDKGKPFECQSCPVALALFRQFSSYRWDSIDTVSVENIIKLNEERYELPEKVYKFIEDFDAGRPVQPFVFDLDRDLPFKEENN